MSSDMHVWTALASWGDSVMPPPPLRQRDYGPSTMTSQVTEDTPPDLLEGSLDLEVTLPNGKKVIMNVNRRTAMMDLLVQVTTAHKINPGDHVIHVYSDRRNMFYKPSTPIGTLDTSAIEIVSRTSANEAASIRRATLQKEAVDRNLRLKVNLPRNQLGVYRVSPSTLVSDIHLMVCQDKGLDPHAYELRHPVNVDERLRGPCSLSDYQLQEVTLVSKDFRAPPLSVNDLLDMSSFARAAHNTSHHSEDRKRKGIKSFFRRNVKSSTGDSSVSSGSAGDRSLSPARSDESIEGRAAHGGAPSNSSSTSTLTSSVAHRTVNGNSVASSRILSVTSLNKSKKRQAPTPPVGLHLTAKSKSGIDQSLNCTPSLKSEDKKSNLSSSLSDSSVLDISRKTNLSTTSSGSSLSISSKGKEKRKAPLPPLLKQKCIHEETAPPKRDGPVPENQTEHQPPSPILLETSPKSPPIEGEEDSINETASLPPPPIPKDSPPRSSVSSESSCKEETALQAAKLSDETYLESSHPVEFDSLQPDGDNTSSRCSSIVVASAVEECPTSDTVEDHHIDTSHSLNQSKNVDDISEALAQASSSLEPYNPTESVALVSNTVESLHAEFSLSAPKSTESLLPANNIESCHPSTESACTPSLTTAIPVPNFTFDTHPPHHTTSSLHNTSDTQTFGMSNSKNSLGRCNSMVTSSGRLDEKNSREVSKNLTRSSECLEAGQERKESLNSLPDDCPESPGKKRKKKRKILFRISSKIFSKIRLSRRKKMPYTNPISDPFNDSCNENSSDKTSLQFEDNFAPNTVLCADTLEAPKTIPASDAEEFEHIVNEKLNSKFKVNAVSNLSTTADNLSLLSEGFLDAELPKNSNPETASQGEVVNQGKEERRRLKSWQTEDDLCTKESEMLSDTSSCSNDGFYDVNDDFSIFEKMADEEKQKELSSDCPLQSNIKECSVDQSTLGKCDALGNASQDFRGECGNENVYNENTPSPDSESTDTLIPCNESSVPLSSDSILTLDEKTLEYASEPNSSRAYEEPTMDETVHQHEKNVDNIVKTSNEFLGGQNREKQTEEQKSPMSAKSTKIPDAHLTEEPLDKISNSNKKLLPEQPVIKQLMVNEESVSTNETIPSNADSLPSVLDCSCGPKDPSGSDVATSGKDKVKIPHRRDSLSSSTSSESGLPKEDSSFTPLHPPVPADGSESAYDSMSDVAKEDVCSKSGSSSPPTSPDSTLSKESSSSGAKVIEGDLRTMDNNSLGASEFGGEVEERKMVIEYEYIGESSTDPLDRMTELAEEESICQKKQEADMTLNKELNGIDLPDKAEVAFPEAIQTELYHSLPNTKSSPDIEENVCSAKIETNIPHIDTNNAVSDFIAKQNVINELKSAVRTVHTDEPRVVNCKPKDYTTVLSMDNKKPVQLEDNSLDLLRNQQGRDSPSVASSTSSCYDSVDEMLTRTSRSTSDAKSSRSSTVSSYESAPPPVPDSKLPDSSSETETESIPVSSSSSAVNSLERRRDTASTNSSSLKWLRPAGVRAPVFSISTYNNRSEEESYGKKLLRSESFQGMKKTRSVASLPDAVKTESLTRSTSTMPHSGRLGRIESLKDVSYSGETSFFRKRVTPYNGGFVYRKPTAASEVSSGEMPSLTQEPQKKEVESSKEEVAPKRSTFRRSRPISASIDFKIGVYEGRPSAPPRKQKEFPPASRIPGDASDSNDKVSPLRKARSTLDIRDNQLPEGSSFPPGTVGGPPESGLANEYMKLQEDFMKWQQQLLQNQHLLHSRVAPIASSQPPFSNAPAGNLGGLKLGWKTPTNWVYNDTMKESSGPRRPVEINIPIKIEGQEDVPDNAPRQPQSQPQRWSNTPNVPVNSWQGGRPDDAPIEKREFVIVTDPPQVFQAPSDAGCQLITNQRPIERTSPQPRQPQYQPAFQQGPSPTVYQSIPQTNAFQQGPSPSVFQQGPPSYYQQVPQQSFQQVSQPVYQQQAPQPVYQQPRFQQSGPAQQTFIQPQQSFHEGPSPKWAAQNDGGSWQPSWRSQKPESHQSNQVAPVTQNNIRQEIGPSSSSVPSDDNLNARFTSVVTLNDRNSQQSAPSKDKVRSVVQLNAIDSQSQEPKPNVAPTVRGFRMPPQKEPSPEPFSRRTYQPWQQQNRAGSVEKSEPAAASMTPMSSRLVQAVQQPQPQPQAAPQPPQRASPPKRERKSPSPVKQEYSPPPFANVNLRPVSESRVSPPKSSPALEAQGPPAPPPPPMPPMAPPPPPMPSTERRTSTGKRIVSAPPKGPELDARAELMMAIRQFGGSEKLRKKNAY